MLPEAGGSNVSLWAWTGIRSELRLDWSPFRRYQCEVLRTPCGFCFVEFYTRPEALASLRYISGTKLDERIVRCDLDAGYKEGRQFGRGKSGGQVRDEHREDYDPGRGGWGAQAQRMEAERRKEVEERYADTTGIVAGGGGEWRQGEVPTQSLKRGRSPDDDGEQERVSMQLPSLYLIP